MSYAFDKELLRLCSDVILNTRSDAAERLVQYATEHCGSASSKPTADAASERLNLSVEQRLHSAILTGNAEHLNADLSLALEQRSAMQIIEQALMPAMEEVGERFGSGRMFLPQVVKSARTLRTAVAALEPHLKSGAGAASAAAVKKVLLATVKGDVHDIGKNIVSIVLACNGYHIIDLGVMAPAEQIMSAIDEHCPDLVGLSALISPSLEEMEHVAGLMHRRGLSIPLLIGGAATTPLHTALRLDAAYPHRVFHVRDASQAPSVARTLTTSSLKHNYTAQQQQRNEQLRRLHASSQRAVITLEEARRNKMPIDWNNYKPVAMQRDAVVEKDVSIADLLPHIDWSMFLYAWGFKGRHEAILADAEQGAAARLLCNDAKAMLNRLDNEKALRIEGVWAFFNAASSDEDILIYKEHSGEMLARIATARQLHQMKDGAPNISIADFVAPTESGLEDYVGLFALSVQPARSTMLETCRSAGNEYDALLIETLCSRLAEAYAEHICARLTAKCLRAAIGYPSLPDHQHKRSIFSLLCAEQSIGISLTESCMMQPPASECGLLLPNPQARYF